MVTESLIAGKSDREVVLESALFIERAQLAAYPLQAGTSATIATLESQLALEREKRIRRQAGTG